MTSTGTRLYACKTLFLAFAVGVVPPVWADGTTPPSSQQAFLTATDNLKSMHWKKAQSGFKDVLKNDPDNLKAHFCLGEIEYYTHHLAEAQGYFQWVNFHDPDMPVNHYYLGRVAYDEKRYDEAISEMESANSLDSRIAMVHYYMGLIHYKKKEFPDSQKELQQAVELDPSSFKAHYALAYLMFHNLKQPSQALQEIAIALNDKPDKETQAKLLKLKKEIKK